MRTCAAAIRTSQETGDPWNTSGIIAADAMNLLTEAAEALDVLEPVGEPMAVLLVQLPPQSPQGVGVPTWGGDLPVVSARPCPSCGSIDARKVRRNGRKLMLTCPACEHEWEYR
jgi:hypothetical protein